MLICSPPTTTTTTTSELQQGNLFAQSFELVTYIIHTFFFFFFFFLLAPLTELPDAAVTAYFLSTPHSATWKMMYVDIYVKWRETRTGTGTGTRTDSLVRGRGRIDTPQCRFPREEGGWAFFLSFFFFFFFSSFFFSRSISLSLSLSLPPSSWGAYVWDQNSGGCRAARYRLCWPIHLAIRLQGFDDRPTYMHNYTRPY